MRDRKRVIRAKGVDERIVRAADPDATDLRCP